MANSLMTGVSGLKSHQKMIEVVGNNLANLNTIGYKHRSAMFSDVFYETIRGGSSGTLGSGGGTNPNQVGTGSQLTSIRTNMTGGGLESTGNEHDLALEGNGFFVVNNGASNLYTRAGAFQIDRSGLITDSGTGFAVQRFGNLGEDNGRFPSFQIPGDNQIHVPLGAIIPGKSTESVEFSGNLPSDGVGPVPQILSSAAWLAAGNPATATTLLNDLDHVTTNFVNGDTIRILGTDQNGASVSQTFTIATTSTVGDLLAAINSAYPEATASLGANGKINLTSDQAGRSFFSLSLTAGPGNTGVADFSTGNFLVTQNGKEGAVVRGGFPLYDISGGVHTVNFEFHKQSDSTWTLNLLLDPSAGTINTGTIQGIEFSPQGEYLGHLGTSKLSVTFNAQPTPIEFDVLMLGNSAVGTGIKSYSGNASISATQDGFENGVLTGIQVDASGIIKAVASNGADFAIAQLAIASFINPHGLDAVGNNFYSASLSSGSVRMSSAGSNGNGIVRSGQLELSNVDVAMEFTRLIIAQRGFSANARTITVSNDILQELTNLIR